MQYVFGSTLVCQTSDDAKKVTFHKSINARSVTREGDLFDPAGTLSGGSRPEGKGRLVGGVFVFIWFVVVVVFFFLASLLC
jgi:structural maintenance of chromosome 2